MENLEHTKKTAAEIEDKVTEARKTSFEIDKVPIVVTTAILTKLFRLESSTDLLLLAPPSSTSSSTISTGSTPCTSSLSGPSASYLTWPSRSLSSYFFCFFCLLHLSEILQRAVMDSNVAQRVANLTDSITFQVFQYTTRSAPSIGSILAILIISLSQGFV